MQHVRFVLIFPKYLSEKHVSGKAVLEEMKSKRCFNLLFSLPFLFLLEEPLGTSFCGSTRKCFGKLVFQ